MPTKTDTPELKRNLALMFALYAMPILFMAYMMAMNLNDQARLNNIETRMNLMGTRVSANTTASQDHERRIGALEH